MVTSSNSIRNVLLVLMQRGRWYSIPELVSIAEQSIVLDSDDRQRRHGEQVFRRQVANAIRAFRPDYHSPELSDTDNTALMEWNGEEDRDSRYRLAPESPRGIPENSLEAIMESSDEAPDGSGISNDGYDAEEYVAGIFRESGWTVVNVRNRGFGYDLVAWNSRSGITLRIEVKSSTSGLVRPRLTEHEMEAARQYSTDFYLATVDNWDGDEGDVQLFRDPANSLTSRERTEVSFHLDRNTGEPEDMGSLMS